VLFLGGRKDFSKSERKAKFLFFKRSCCFNEVWPVAEARNSPEQMKEGDSPSRLEGDSSPSQSILELAHL